MKTPISAYDETSGMLYFARLLDKIRKMDSSELREDFTDNLGGGLDGRCLNFLRIDYSDLIKQTLSGGTDEEILKWCFEHGRELDDNDIFIWNEFLKKVGWRDGITEKLIQRKQEGNMEDRDDIVTMIDYFDVDEGRK